MIHVYYRSLLLLDKPMEIRLNWKAIAKERPRLGRGGRVFTPKATREFETKMAEAGSTLLRRPYTCPVKITVRLYDPIPKSYKGMKLHAARENLINPPVGDLDNKIKAITDGLNGVAYVDDKQINKIDAERRYGNDHAIYVLLERNGLSAKELEDYGNQRDYKSRP